MDDLASAPTFGAVTTVRDNLLPATQRPKRIDRTEEKSEHEGCCPDPVEGLTRPSVTYLYLYIVQRYYEAKIRGIQGKEERMMRQRFFHKVHKGQERECVFPASLDLGRVDGVFLDGLENLRDLVPGKPFIRGDDPPTQDREDGE